MRARSTLRKGLVNSRKRRPVRSGRSMAISVGRRFLGRTRGAVVAAGTFRQIDLHRRAMTDCAVDPDVAVRLLDEAVDHAETEPGTLADILGREERLEDAIQHVLRHALSGVA